MKIVGEVKNKNILLLQGPIGSYFNTLDKKFSDEGAKVFRIGFNAADEFFANTKHYTAYKNKPKDWNDFIKSFFIKNRINKIFVFGDCRYYQNIAIQIAKNLDIEVFVFEEGYLRPNFITLEKYGVNDNSLLPRNKEFYNNLDLDDEIVYEMEHLEDFGSTYNKMAKEAILYYWIANLFHHKYPHYLHHRCMSLKKEFKAGCLNIFRKYINNIKEKKLNQYFEKELSKKYYFVPLQTHNDFQILTHSKYKNIEEFIEEVIASFSKYVPNDKHLVFKHHPVDRGRRNYKELINILSRKYNIKNRVLVTWDTHLPTQLKHAIGTIVINSTVGLSSLYHQTPTICLGNAIYDIEDLTCKNMNIDEFWLNYEEVDSELFKKFRAYLIQTTQINSNFYL